MSTSAVSVSTTPTVLVTISTVDRIQILFDNRSEKDVFVNDTVGGSTSTGWTIPANDKFIMDLHELRAKTTNKLVLWGVVESGTADVRVWEWFL